MMGAYLMRVRKGKPGGGKGPLLQDDVSGTLGTTNDQRLFQSVDDENYVVRRITPLETERLQGLPDGHTDLTGCNYDSITEKLLDDLKVDQEREWAVRRSVRRWTNRCPDNPRYKCTGNAFSVPVIQWLGKRIELVESLLSERRNMNANSD